MPLVGKRPVVVGAAVLLLVVGAVAWGRRGGDGCPDSRSLQRRIDEAKAQAVLTLSGDHCLDQRVTISGKKGLTIQGDGTANLRQARSNRDKMIVVSKASDITLRRLEITGSSPSAGNRPGAYSDETAGSAAISLKGVAGMRIEELHVHDVYGDFVDLDSGKDDGFTSDVVIEDNRFERSGRQGVSFGANVRSVIVTRNRINEVRRSVFDFEPGVDEAETTDVRIIENHVNDFRNYFVTVAGLGRLDGLRIERNVVAVKGGDNGGLGFVRIGARKEGRQLVTGIVVCANQGDLVDENSFEGAADSVTTCG